MAMNKKEKAYVQELEQKLKEKNVDIEKRLAFKLTDKVEEDLEPPESISEPLSKGYSFNVHNMTASKSCSSSIGHGLGRHDKTGSQRPIKQFSSMKLALMALRHEYELKVMDDLYSIDQKIKAEIEKEKGE